MPPKHASVAEPAWLRTRAIRAGGRPGVRGVEADWGFEGVCIVDSQDQQVGVVGWGLSLVYRVYVYTGPLSFGDRSSYVS